MNPNAISKDRPYEIGWSRSERTNFILPSGYTVQQGFALLRKLWKMFMAYRHDFNTEGQMTIGAKIQDIQREMGIAVAQFPELGLFITDEELPADMPHTFDEVETLHDQIEERKAAEEDGGGEFYYSDVALEDAYSKRRGCEYWRQY